MNEFPSPQPQIQTHPTTDYDVILVGGGLQAGLIVMALRHQKPSVSILLIEQSDRLAGNHTWSFHPGDVPPAARAWVEPLIETQWDACDVRISGLEKPIELPYASMSSSHFADVITDRISHGPGEILLNQSVSELSDTAVRIENNTTYQARLVIDCRGPQRHASIQPSGADAGRGFQKFWGFEVETLIDWPRPIPTIMDDAIDQTDGFRFLYSLPFAPRRILVEDTRFSDSTDLDREECLANVTDYLSNIGINDWTIVREENGVLPMPYSVNAMPERGGDGAVLAGGYAGGWFHPATGYSFPMAVAFADAISSVPIGDTSGNTITAQARQRIAELAREHQTRSLFARFLNRLLFCLVKPTTRYQIFRRFYRVLSPAAIARFYAHRFTFGDAFRIVVGIPPRGLRPIRFARSFWRASASSVSMNRPTPVTVANTVPTSTRPEAVR